MIGRTARAIELLVVHNISLPPGEFGGPGIVELFTNRLDPAAHPYYREIQGLRVSSHFLIRRDGELIQFVACGKRAWHAGQSEWRGRGRCNDFSVGVSNWKGRTTCRSRTPSTLQLARLTRALGRAYPITDCVGHSDIATPPGRKTDPGPLSIGLAFGPCSKIVRSSWWPVVSGERKAKNH